MANRPKATQPQMHTVPAQEQATQEQSAAPVKVKRERLFKPVMDFSDAKRAQMSLTAKYNRVGRGIKVIGLPGESEKQILDVLAVNYEAQIKRIYSDPEYAASLIPQDDEDSVTGETTPGGSESFV